MNQIFKKTTSLSLAVFFFLQNVADSLAAAPLPGGDPGFDGLQNPAIDPNLGQNLGGRASDGRTFASYFVVLWRAIIVFAAIFLLVYFLWGAFLWLTAGGDNSKVQKARDQMTNALIGFIILLGSFSIVAFIGQVIGFNLLDITLPAV